MVNLLNRLQRCILPVQDSPGLCGKQVMDSCLLMERGLINPVVFC